MKQITTLLVALLLSTAGSTLWAGDCDDCHDHAIHCPNCHCELSLEKVKEKKYCWDVECQAICIPKIKFPWESCCGPPKCAKLKYVHVLKKIEYECEHCQYKWAPVCHECGDSVGGCTHCAAASAP